MPIHGEVHHALDDFSSLAYILGDMSECWTGILPSRFDFSDPFLSRPSPPPRVEGHLSFQPQSAGIQSDGDES